MQLSIMEKHGGLGSGDYYYQYGYTSNKTYLKVGNSSKTKSICLTGLKSSKKVLVINTQVQ